jgi:insulysin
MPIPAQSQPVAMLVTNQLETPSGDNRLYKVVILLNQVEMLIIYDPDTDKAGAAMDVNMGNFSDNQDMQGMAHIVEYKLRVLYSFQEANFSRYLLIIGTKKYPIENDYQQYLLVYNRNYNRYIFVISTNYYFEVDIDTFYRALD